MEINVYPGISEGNIGKLIRHSNVCEYIDEDKKYDDALLYINNTMLSPHKEELLETVSCVNNLKYCGKKLKNGKCEYHDASFNKSLFVNLIKQILSFNDSTTGKDNKYKIVKENLTLVCNNINFLLVTDKFALTAYKKFLSLFDEDVTADQWDGLMDIFIKAFKIEKIDTLGKSQAIKIKYGSKYLNKSKFIQ